MARRAESLGPGACRGREERPAPPPALSLPAPWIRRGHGSKRKKAIRFIGNMKMGGRAVGNMRDLQGREVHRATCGEKEEEQSRVNVPEKSVMKPSYSA